MRTPNVTTSDTHLLSKHQLISNHCRISKKIEEAASVEIVLEDAENGLKLRSSSESVVEQPQESPSKLISRESAPQAGEDLPQPVPQLAARRIEAPQPLAEPIPQARAPLAEQRPASPKRMRERTNVTENQIVQLPPGLNIFKNSEILKDVKLAADM